MRHEREKMVEQQIARRGVSNPAVLEAMRTVKRHRLLPDKLKFSAYADSPLPIGFGQTISQPYIVALMTELLEPQPEHKTLEIGAGSGYQAAVLAEIVKDVYTIEIVPELAERAARTLASLGCDNVHCRCGDGGVGWPEEAPFDGIIVTAAARIIPGELTSQLKIGGRLVIPYGDAAGIQCLSVIVRNADGLKTIPGIAVRFVPMTGATQRG